MTVGGARTRPGWVRPGVTAGVGQLEADDEPIRAAVPFGMCADERATERFEIGERVVANHQLTGVRPAVRPDGNRLPAPDQFRAAQTEVTPPADRQLARPAVRRAVPTLHWQDREAV